MHCFSNLVILFNCDLSYSLLLEKAICSRVCAQMSICCCPRSTKLCWVWASLDAWRFPSRDSWTLFVLMYRWSMYMYCLPSSFQIIISHACPVIMRSFQAQRTMMRRMSLPLRSRHNKVMPAMTLESNGPIRMTLIVTRNPLVPRSLKFINVCCFSTRFQG